MPDEVEKSEILSAIMRHVEDNIAWVQDYQTGYGQWGVIPRSTCTEFANRMRELCDQLAPPESEATSD